MNRKTAVVTGGSRGIGKATAELLATKGYNVVFTYLSGEERAKDILKKITDKGGEASIFRYDAVKDADSLAEFAVKRYGKIDLLVANAGISLQKIATETTDEEWNRVIECDLSGVFYINRSVLKNMIERKSGSIVNVSSVYGISGGSAETAYSAAKAGVIGFTKALAKEVACSGISVNCVAPGAIDTEMNKNLNREEIENLCSEIPFGRLGKAEEVAETILFLAESSYITGQVISPNGGLII
ncbi:MAG: 3-oxoacyl-ACP reductase FabG [Ruminococcaceae bacterium]|nr:3-oxoacyl-ACP reductase FabG [Oscillospiraceae bacterium]